MEGFAMIQRYLKRLLLLALMAICCLHAGDPASELSNELKKIAISMQPKKEELIKQAKIAPERYRAKTANELIDSATHLRGIARNVDFKIREAEDYVDDPRGRCNNLGIWERWFDVGGMKSYCKTLQPSRVYKAEQAELQDRAFALFDLATIKDNEAVLANARNEIDKNKIEFNLTYLGAKLAPKEQLDFLKELNEQELRAQLTKLQKSQEESDKKIADRAVRLHLGEDEVAAFAAQRTLNRFMQEEIEKEIGRRQPIIQRAQGTMSRWGKWFSSPEEVKPHKTFRGRLGQLYDWVAGGDAVVPRGPYDYRPVRVMKPQPVTPPVVEQPIFDVDVYEQWKQSKPLHPGEIYNPVDFE
jgi:hypothetical protein